MDQVLYVVRAEHARFTHIIPHHHECYELIYYFKGNGTSMIGEHSYHFQAGTYALISPHQQHDEDHRGDAEVLFVGFQTDLSEIGELQGMHQDDREHSIHNYMLQLNTEYTRRGEGAQDYLNDRLHHMLLHLLHRGGNSMYPLFSGDRLQHVLAYMNEHFTQRLSIEMLADMSGYSYDRFRHLFQEKYGASPSRYMLIKRLDYSKHLLASTQMSISDVSAESGFVNDAQFCNMFKRETGITPRSYRKSLQLKSN